MNYGKHPLGKYALWIIAMIVGYLAIDFVLFLISFVSTLFFSANYWNLYALVWIRWFALSMWELFCLFKIVKAYRDANPQVVAAQRGPYKRGMFKIVKILGILAPILVANAVLALSFIDSNLLIWDRLNRFDLTESRWDAYSFVITPVRIMKDRSLFYQPTCFPQPNYPFMLFWVSTIMNLLYITWVAWKKNSS